MILKPPRKKKNKFLLPFGLSLEGGRCGAAVREFTECYLVEGLRHAPYDYGFLIVASRDRMFPLFIALSEFVGEPCAGFLVHHLPRPEMAFVSGDLTKGEVLDAFTRHSFQLVNDGFVSFGISSDEIEIAVEDHKNFTVFCKSSRQVLSVLEEYGIPMGPKSKWINIVEHVHIPLNLLFEDAWVKSVCEPMPREEIEKFNSDPEGYKKFYADIILRLRMGFMEEYKPSPQSHVHPG
jgi:hypothetical protein